MARDIFHHAVRQVLENDGWTITDDPYYLVLQKSVAQYEIDLGAERLLGAEKGTEKIAVEVKSLLKTSLLHEFHSVLGQYLIYHYGLSKKDPTRKLYLALPDFAQTKLEKISPLLDIIRDFEVKIIYFDSENKTIVSWEK
jgi:XisH protein